MKKKSVKFKHLLFKSFCRADKMLIVLIIASFLCSLLISGIWSINSASKIKRLQDARLLFGEYQVMVSDIDKSLAENILKTEKEVKISSLYTQRILQDEKGFSNIIYAQEDFFNLSQMNLKAGTFPKAQNEILVDDLYAFKKGEDAKELIGSKIDFNEKEYIVTGVINNTDFNIAYINTHTFVLNYAANVGSLDNKENISFFLSINSADISNFINKLSNSYKIDSNFISYNNSAYDYAGINTKGQPNGIEGIFYRVIVIVLGFLSIFLIYTLCILFIKKLKPTTSICVALGVDFKKIYKSYVTFIMFFIFLSFILSLIISTLLSALLFNLNYSQVIAQNVFSIIIIAVVFSIVGLLLILNIMTNKINKVEQNLKNPVGIKNNRVKSAINKRYKSLYLSLSKQNIAVEKGRAALYTLIIVISSVLFSVSIYSVQIFRDSSQKVQGFDYLLEFKFNNVAEMLDGLKEHEELYKNIKNDIGTNKYSLFFEEKRAGLNKSNITKEHRNYLEKLSTEMSASLNNPNTDIVNIPVVFMSLDNNTIKRISEKAEGINISQNECVVVKNTIDAMGSSFEIGLNAGDQILITIPLDESEIEEIEIDDTQIAGEGFVQPKLPETTKTQSLKVVDTIDYLDINLQQIKNLPLVIVSKDIFDKICTNNKYPSMILFDNDTENPDYLEKYFSGKSGIQLINLVEENKVSEEYFDKIDFSLMAIMFILIIFLTLIMSITIVLRYDESKAQYAVMRAIGIRSSNVMKIFIYEALYLSIISALITVPLSILGTFIIYKSFISQSVFFIYKIPVFLITMPIVCFIIVSIISYLPVILKMQKQSIAEVIKYE